MTRFYEYVLEFTDKDHADDVINDVRDKLIDKLSKRFSERIAKRFVRIYMSRYDVGQVKEYVYDDEDPEAPPTVNVISELYHVHLRVRTYKMPQLTQYVSDVDIHHSFA